MGQSLYVQPIDTGTWEMVYADDVLRERGECAIRAPQRHSQS
jgi:hypothetical protein